MSTKPVTKPYASYLKWKHQREWQMQKIEEGNQYGRTIMISIVVSFVQVSSENTLTQTDNVTFTYIYTHIATVVTESARDVTNINECTNARACFTRSLHLSSSSRQTRSRNKITSTSNNLRKEKKIPSGLFLSWIKLF
jgi:hypothetical protein